METNMRSQPEEDGERFQTERSSSAKALRQNNRTWLAQKSGRVQALGVQGFGESSFKLNLGAMPSNYQRPVAGSVLSQEATGLCEPGPYSWAPG